MRGHANTSRIARCARATPILFSSLGLLVVELSGAARAADPPQDPGGASPIPAVLVRVRLPLTGGDGVPKTVLTGARDRLLGEARRQGDGRRPIVVLELSSTTGGVVGGLGTQFEHAFSLADFVSSREMAGVKTVAWVPQTVRGHGVLLAAACEEIVMREEAEIGDAGADEPKGRAMRRAVVEAYREIADARRTLPASVAVAMVDPSVELLKVESETGEHFVLSTEMDEFRAGHEVLSEETLAAAGSLARFTGREGRRYGFVKYLASDKTGLAKALGTSIEALEEDDSLATSWRPAVIDIQGPITRKSVSEVKTLLGNELSAGNVNWVALRIDSVGGHYAACVELANYMAQLDPNAVRTVAYVAVEARGGAALVALACDQLVMHPAAEIGVGAYEIEIPPGPDGARPQRGDPRRLQPGPQGRRDARGGAAEGISQAELLAAKRSIRESLAPRVDRNWSLLAATLDPGIELYVYRDKESGVESVMSAEAAAELPNSDNWTRGEALTGAQDRFALTGTKAAERGIARPTIEGFDELLRLYGIAAEPRQLRSNWALQLVAALASPGMAGLLILFGLAGLYIEAKTPGVGLGGIVATVAFLLFFWSKHLDQTATWLEILLFATGVVFLIIEVFVLPGFGVFGVGGALLVIFSLVLASQTFVIPHTDAQLGDLTRSLEQVAGAFAGLVVVALAMRRLLPHAPFFHRIVLAPAAEEERILLHGREMLADFAHLVGRRGNAVTDLLPSGKALIGGELVDVIAEDDAIDRGAVVEVISAKANRVVVRWMSLS